MIIIFVLWYRRYKANQAITNLPTPNQCGQISATSWNPQAYPGTQGYDQAVNNQGVYNQTAQGAYNQGAYNGSPQQVYPTQNVVVNGGAGYPQGSPVYLDYS